MLVPKIQSSPECTSRICLASQSQGIAGLGTICTSHGAKSAPTIYSWFDERPYRLIRAISCLHHLPPISRHLLAETNPDSDKTCRLVRHHLLPLTRLCLSKNLQTLPKRTWDMTWAPCVLCPPVEGEVAPPRRPRPTQATQTRATYLHSPAYVEWLSNKNGNLWLPPGGRNPPRQPRPGRLPAGIYVDWLSCKKRTWSYNFLLCGERWLPQASQT